MRNIAERGQLNHLGIDEDELHFLRRLGEQQAGQYGFHADRFAGAGRARHEQMWHGGQVRSHDFPFDILAERQHEMALLALEIPRLKQLAQQYRIALRVWDLDADAPFAGG